MIALSLLYSCILWYIIIIDMCYILLLFASLKTIFFSYIEQKSLKTTGLIRNYKMPPVTVIIPVFNGSDLILESIYSVLNSNSHEQIRIIVVNDGSTDETLNIIINTFEMQQIPNNYPETIKIRHKVRGQYYSKYNINIILVDKENGGKSDALNSGLNLCETDLFITLDHDTIVKPDAIFILVVNLLHKKNALAIGGAIYVANGCIIKNGKIISEEVSTNLICAAQTCEYLRSFLYGRAGWEAAGGSLCYSGAFTLFDYNAVMGVGGFDYNNVANDFEIITHLQAKAHSKYNQFSSHLGFAPSAIAWTYAPTNLKAYWKQRTNWQMGSIQSLMRHKKLFFNRKYGVIGMLTYPFFLLGEIFAPFIIGTGYIICFICWLFGMVNYYWVLIILLVSFGLSLSVSLSTMLISFLTFNKYRTPSDKWRLFAGVLAENLGLRQMLVCCNFIATLKYFFGKRPALHL